MEIQRYFRLIFEQEEPQYGQRLGNGHRGRRGKH